MVHIKLSSNNRGINLTWKNHQIYDLTMNVTRYKSSLEMSLAEYHDVTAFHTLCCTMYALQCTLFCVVSDSIRGEEWSRYLLEFIIIVLPMAGTYPFLEQFYIYCLNISIIILLLFEIRSYCNRTKIKKNFAQTSAFKNGRVQTIPVVTGLTYLIIMLSTVAVDFRTFLKKISITENYWYSLMDTIIGLFVFISGLEHKHLSKSVVATLKSNVKFILVLLYLAAGRYSSVMHFTMHVAFREHNVEYGVLWHFFVTIVMCKLISSLLLCCSDKRLLLSIITLAIHELLLYYDLEKWVFLDTPRPDLIAANREGISSTLGYVSMYLFAAHCQSILLDKDLKRSKVQIYLTSTVSILWLLTYVVPVYRPETRTLANAGFCFYIESTLLTIIVITYFLEVVCDDFETPLIFSLLNAKLNSIICFLLFKLLMSAYWSVTHGKSRNRKYHH